MFRLFTLVILFLELALCPGQSPFEFVSLGCFGCLGVGMFVFDRHRVMSLRGGIMIRQAARTARGRYVCSL
jgi:hypothetical protein